MRIFFLFLFDHLLHLISFLFQFFTLFKHQLLFNSKLLTLFFLSFLITNHFLPLLSLYEFKLNSLLLLSFLNSLLPFIFLLNLFEMLQNFLIRIRQEVQISCFLGKNLKDFSAFKAFKQLFNFCWLLMSNQELLRFFNFFLSLVRSHLHTIVNNFLNHNLSLNFFDLASTAWTVSPMILPVWNTRSAVKMKARKY